jgi:pullulanase/glycogen debranching enzyme
MALCAIAQASAGSQAATLASCNAPGFQQLLRGIPPDSTTDARAVWLNRQLIQWPQVAGPGVFKLYHAADGQIVARPGAPVSGAQGAIALDIAAGAPPAADARRFKHLAPGIVLSVPDAQLPRLAELHQQQLVLVQEDGMGVVRQASALQVAGALDDLFQSAAEVADLGVSLHTQASAAASTGFKLWAPTAHAVAVCLYAKGSGDANSMAALQRDAATGIWSIELPGDRSGNYYKFLVNVFVRDTGVVRNAVTDPYALSAATDSQRGYIADLDAPALKPRGWDAHATPTTVKAQTDMVVYELHVRDFSVNDASVPAAHRGKYLAFTDTASNGMRHLRALARAGMTDLHLLPVFDFATVPETGCVTPAVPLAAPDSEDQQAVVTANASKDCFNWGYDPFLFNTPEGSYASDAANGAKRIVEFRRMVMALHRAGLRVGMDVVYNHTAASGQQAQSVLDRVVPGYYHRLDANGRVERSTCCDNTATENRMMGKLMQDSVALWARHYRIDSLRFDLMGHQPRAVMETLQARADQAAGRHVNLIGEGWNFGEVANGQRFVQASQLSLNGSGIGTFNDRGRDALRGGGAGDSGEALVKRQGYVNGLVYDPNALAYNRHTMADLLQTADMVRLSLAGSLRGYPLLTWQDKTTALQNIPYGDQPAGYVSQPGEVVNYVENHDNETLFDINAYRLPLHTSREDRARVQMLAAAITLFSQGVAYFHAGVDTLRSKSMDRNSFDSGDWFNRLDWRYQRNYFGTGAPPKTDNGANYAQLKPLLANPAIQPRPADIALARNMFRDLLKLRASSTLFRLRSAQDVQQRLRFLNTGSTQNPVVMVGHLDGQGYDGARFKELLYLVNVDKQAQEIVLPSERGKAYRLHPVQASAQAADQRARKEAAYAPGAGSFTLPERSAVVYVVD